MTTEIANINTDELVPNVQITLGKIEIKNEKEIENLLKVAEKYKGLIITNEDDYKFIKDKRASLNKVNEQINRYRIDYKDEAYKPIAEFEEVMNGYFNTVESARKELDATAKAYEQKLKDDKQLQVDELIKKYGEERVIEESPKWLNKTMTLAKVKAEIIEQVEQQKADEEQERKNIEAVTKAAEDENLTADGYIHLIKAGIDVIEILTNISNDGKLKREKEKRIAEEEQSKKQAQEDYNTQMAGIPRSETKVEPVKEIPEVIAEPDETGEILHDTIRVSGTMTQLKKLNEAIKALGIKVEQV